MSRTVRKMQKKILEQKSATQQQSLDRAVAVSERSDLLKKLCDDIFSRQELSRQELALDHSILDTLKALLEGNKAEDIANKQLKEELQQKRRELQEAWDELGDVKDKLKKLQAEKASLEQNLRQKEAELEETRGELHRVEEIASLKAECEHIEQEIARYERKLAKNPKSREIYESRLAELKKARERCLARLEQLQGGNAGNFPYDSAFMFLSEESYQNFWKFVRSSQPTDEVIIRSKEDEFRFLNIWGASSYDVDVPSDFILSGTVPLTDFIITFSKENFSARVINFNCGGSILFGERQSDLSADECDFFLCGSK